MGLSKYNKTAPSSASSLLPSGFVDVLAPEANAEAIAISTLMDKFIFFGYQRIKPPLAEFESSLLSASGQAMDRQTFRVMDPVSHRMMGIRSDITPQISRIATSRLHDEERPLRLTYANDVLRTSGNQQRTERQFCQVGCEIIGSADVQSDIEACVVSIVGLKALGLNNIGMDLTIPRLIDHILDDLNISTTEYTAIKAAVAKKDIRSVRDINDEAGSIFQNLFDISGQAKDGLERLCALSLKPVAMELIQSLVAVVDGVGKAIDELGFSDVNLTIDPLEFSGFDYQSGVAFTIFSPDVRGEIGRGGRYHVHAISDEDNTEDAVGFTLYMDTVRKAMPAQQEPPVKEVPAATSWANIQDNQNQGFVVKRKLNR